MNTRIEKLHLWGKYVLLAAFVLLLSFPWLQAKADEKMTDYTTLTPYLWEKSDGTALPDYVENGQPIYFNLLFDKFKTAELLDVLKKSPEPVIFTVGINFANQVVGKYYDTRFPVDDGNIAYWKGEKLFRWWIEDNTIKICFEDEWIKSTSDNISIDGAKVGFQGALKVVNKDDDGQFVFSVENMEIPLQLKTEYSIAKRVTAPTLQGDHFVVTYTVPFTIDQNMNISGQPDDSLYSAVPSLVDIAGNALSGEIVGTPAVTGPTTGLTVSAVRDGQKNTFSFTGADVMQKGAYTLTYTMKLTAEAAAAKLQGYSDADKTNTIELMENGASLTTLGEPDPLQARAKIAWDKNLSSQYKISKAIIPQTSTTNVYYTNDKYYVDYCVVAYSKVPVSTFTVQDQLTGNVEHSGLPVTLLGVNTKENFWESSASVIPSDLTQVTASVTPSGSGATRSITVSGTDLPAGAYYLKVPVDVTKAVTSIIEKAAPLTNNTTASIVEKYVNMAVLDSVNGDDSVQETSKEVVDFLRGPENFIKRGAVVTKEDGSYDIYNKAGEEGKYIRWDVYFSWSIPCANMIIEDTLSAGQKLLINDSTSFDIWDVTSATPIRLAGLWNKNGTEYIQFTTDSNGAESFVLNLNKLGAGDTTRKFKLVYYTLIDKNATDFDQYTNDWKITYQPHDPGSAIGPIPGRETPVTVYTAVLKPEKKSLDAKGQEQHDMYTRWSATINNDDKLPLSSITKLSFTDTVAVNESTSLNISFANGEPSAWFDLSDTESIFMPVLTMALPGVTEPVNLVKDIDYFITVNGDNSFTVDFDLDRLAEILATHNQTYFSRIDMAIKSQNSNLANKNFQQGKDPQLSIDNTISLDYEINHDPVNTEDVTANLLHRFTSVLKSALKHDTTKEIYADFIGDKNKELKWQIEIGSGYFHASDDTPEIVVVDTLPEELTLYDIENWQNSFDIHTKHSGSTIDKNKIEFTWDEETNTFTLRFKKPKRGTDEWVKDGPDADYNVMIDYYTVFRDSVLQDAFEQLPADETSAVFADMKNKAEVYLEGLLLEAPECEVDVTVKDLLLDKSGKKIDAIGNTALYTIEINPYGLKMGNSGSIVLEDTLGTGKENHLYIPASFKLTNRENAVAMTNGSNATASTYKLTMSSDEKSFMLEVPDQTPITMTYQVKTTNPVGQSNSLQNSASLAGHSPQVCSLNYAVSSSFQGIDVSVKQTGFAVLLRKLEDGSENNWLDGAKFEYNYYVCNGSTDVFKKQGFPETKTLEYNETKYKGIAEINIDNSELGEQKGNYGFLHVKETQAPEGYQMSDPAWSHVYLILHDAFTGDVNEVISRLKSTYLTDVTLVEHGKVATEVVTNEKAADAGSLKIIKSLSDASAQVEIPQETLFRISGPTGVKEIRYSDFTNGVYTAKNLPVGTYTVKEIVQTAEVADHAVFVQYGTDPSAEAAVVEIAKNSTEEVSIQNTYVQDKGSLKITKTFVGVPDNDALNKLVFIINDGTTETIVSYDQFINGEYFIRNVPVGTKYTVKENNADTLFADTPLDVYELTANSTTEGEATISKGEEALIELENIYMLKPGALKISKVVPAELTDKAKEQEFTFEVTFMDELMQPWSGTLKMGKGTLDVKDGKATVTLKGGESVTLTEIPAGLKYQVEETCELPGWLIMRREGPSGTIAAAQTAESKFTNGYSLSGQASIEVKKELLGRDLTKDEFTFKILDQDGNAVGNEDRVAITATNGADGSVLFPQMTYTKEGTWEYRIVEVIPGDDEIDNTVEYSTEEIVVTVTAKDENGDGKLTTTVTYSPEDKTITNTLKPGVLEISKTVNSTNMAHEDKVFTFTVELTDKDGKLLNGSYVLNDTASIEVRDGKATITLSGGESAVISGLPAGTQYSVTETAESGFTAESEGESGVIEPTKTAEASFTNTYAAQGVYDFNVTKTLAGREMAEGEFEFVLLDEAGNELETARNSADGTVSFSQLTFTDMDVGTRVYSIKETDLKSPGVTYDKTVREITLTITDNGNGTLNVTDSLNGEAVEFSNTYSDKTSISVQKVWQDENNKLSVRPESVTVELYRNGEKQAEIELNAENEWQHIFADLAAFDEEGVTYTYTVKEAPVAGSDSMQSLTDGARVITNTVQGVLDVSKTVVGGTDESKEFTFTVTLTKADAPVIKELVLTKDESSEIATPDAEGKVSFTLKHGETVRLIGLPIGTAYKVEETEEAGYATTAENAEGLIQRYEEHKASFTNTYEAVGETSFSGKKTLEGRELAAGEFSCTLYDANGDEIETVQNAADGSYAFSKLEYIRNAEQNDLGEHRYTVKEVKGALKGVTYDDAEYTVKVTVTDNGDGTLKVVASENAAALDFINYYDADGELTLRAAKTVNGAEPRTDEVFTFELCDAAGKVLQTAKNAQGKITFEALKYTEADVGKSYLYTVKEKQEEKPGYTTDATVYTVAVWVADGGDGSLKVTKAISSEGKAVEAMTFDNTYEAEGEWKPIATKTVNGAEPREDQVYEFTLTDKDGNTILAENEKGEITFDALTYDLADAGKTYTYMVKEITTPTDLLATDDSTYTVDVTVTDNQDGTLDVKPVITKDGETAEKITFENKLTTLLSISKTVEGTETTETFPMTVKLYNANGTEAEGEYAYTGDAEGKLKSGDAIELAHGQSVTISGLLPGMTYTVTEAAAAAYETTVNGNAGNSIEGTLAENANEVSFVNKYKTTMFMVKKSWQGGGGGAIELTLYANGEKIEPQPIYSRDENVYVYTDLPMYDEQDQPIVYSAKERYVDGFLTIYKNVAPYADETKAIYDGGTIINKAIVKADFSVKKEWSGLAEGETAPEIELVLYCNGVATDIKTPNPDRNGWYKYYDLPGEVDGQPAVYTVKELPVEGYETSYKLANGISAEYADNGGTITNAKIPQTGDETPLAMWLTLMGASAMMLVLLLKRRKV